VNKGGFAVKQKIVFGQVFMSLIALSLIVHAGSASPKPSHSKNQDILIGVSVLDLANPYYVQIVKGIQKEAEGKNIKLIINDPKSNVKRQIAAVKRFIAIGVKALIIAALDQDALEDVLGKAMEKGIKIVAQSTKVEHRHIQIIINEWDMGHTIGQEAGKWIRDNLGGQAEVAILNYPRIALIANREKGIRDGITEFAPKARVVGAESAGNPLEGKKATLKILKLHPNVKVLVGVNEGATLGALAAFNELGVNQDKLFIGGVDATPEALEKIRQGTAYRGTVDISPYYNGMLDLKFALKLINGQTVPNQYSIPVKLITREHLKKTQ
jgi:ribose transport system substrate-binding protein